MALTQYEKLERKAARAEKRATEKARQKALRQEERKELRAWLKAHEARRRAAMTPAERDAEDAEEAREIHELMEGFQDVKDAPNSVLGIKYGSTKEEAKAAYRALAKIHHPDHGGNPEMMAKINIAYEKL